MAQDIVHSIITVVLNLWVWMSQEDREVTICKDLQDMFNTQKKNSNEQTILLSNNTRKRESLWKYSTFNYDYYGGLWPEKV